jgi:DHA3 family tetracycline resistance protein-like MFS transporter
LAPAPLLQTIKIIVITTFNGAPSLLNSLKFRPFALLWSGQTISRLGDSLYRIALSWWVLEKTGSAAAMGTVLIFSFTPMILFLLIGGIAADRFPRLKLMLVSDIVRGVLVLLVAYLAYSNHLEIWHIYGLSLAFGFADAFFQPAYIAVVPELTPNNLLPGANALTSLSSQLSGIVGPAIGAFIVKAGGTSLAFALNGVSFFIAAVCLIPLILRTIQADSRPKTTQLRRNVWADLHEGWKAVIVSPWLWISILVAAFANMMLSGPMAITVPFFVKEYLHADVDTLGLLLSMFSIGSVAGAVVISRFKHYRRRGLLVYIPWLTAGLVVSIAGFFPTAIVAGTVMFLAGAGFSIGGLIWLNVLQELVPGELLGRVSSMDALGSFVLIPVGYALCGWLTDLVGPPLVMIISGLSAAFVTSLGLLHPSVRSLD